MITTAKTASLMKITMTDRDKSDQSTRNALGPPARKESRRTKAEGARSGEERSPGLTPSGYPRRTRV